MVGAAISGWTGAASATRGGYASSDGPFAACWAGLSSCLADGAGYVDEAVWTDVLDARFWGATESYTLVDALLGVKLHGGRYSFAVRATNLTDEQAKQHVFGDIIGRRVTAEIRAGIF